MIRRRGFAIVIAFVSLALVGAALVTMTSLLAAQSVRARAASRETQLRQLLLAGALVVSQDAKKWQATPGNADATIALPQDLLADGATLGTHRATSGDGAVVVEILATLGRGRMSQTLRFARFGDSYRVVSANLNET